MNSGRVYYRNGWGIHGGNTSIDIFNKTSSTKEEFVTGDINNSFGLYIIGNYLYYIDGNAITKKNL
jgi:hypothetical protein